MLYFLWMKSAKLESKQGSRYWHYSHKTISVCFLQSISLFFTCWFMQGKSFVWRLLEGRSHKRTWSVRLRRVRSRQSICLLLLTWSVTLGKPHILCGLHSSLPFTVCHSKQCQMLLLCSNVVFSSSLSCTGVEKSGLTCLLSFICFVGMISCYCWYSPCRLKFTLSLFPLYPAFK